MEFALNLVWLVLAIASVSLWSILWRRAFFVRSRRADAFRSAIGLLCVLLFMFYAISLSDDLYEMTVVVEEPPALRLRTSRFTTPDNHIPAAASTTLAMQPLGIVILEPLTFFAISMSNLPVPRPASFNPAALRAPPRCS